MNAFVGAGLLDSFRALHPEQVKYSWWSYRAGAREKNVGWRIDYFLISEAFIPKLQEAFILNDVFGSDHCPVGVVIA
jgi:exodeoxyribonuclease-3